MGYRFVVFAPKNQPALKLPLGVTLSLVGAAGWLAVLAHMVAS